MSDKRFIESDAKPTSVDPNKVLNPLEDQPKPADSPWSDVVHDYSHPNKKFQEREHVADQREYPRVGTNPGLVVIFNQQIFDDKEQHKDRRGTNRDVNELITTFGRLGYNIEKQHIHNNLSKDEILDKIKKLSQQDHSHTNSLIIVVLSHGDENDIIYARDKHIYTYDIWQPFSEKTCTTLKNKPKFFIFQACKGKQYSNPTDIQGDVVPRFVYQAPLEPNMLIAFAAGEGNMSYRHINNGSWFIQELCKNFSSYGRRDDVVSLLIRTTKCVANSYYDAEHKTVKKQMPLIISSLTKKFYLTRSKDRNLMLEILKEQQDIVKTLKEVYESQARLAKRIDRLERTNWRI